MTIKPIRLFTVSFAVLLAFAIGACEDDSSSDTSNSYTATQSPGDVWSWTLTSSTFTATNDTTGFTYSGGKETLANLFLKLTVTASTDPGVPLDGTAVAFALEVPGTALIVKPADTDGKAIVGVGQGSCPTADATYNWITIPRADWDAASSEAYGTADSTVSGSDISFDVSAFMLDGNPVGSNTASTTCSNGVMTETGSTTTIGIAPSGTFVGDNGPNDGGFIGVVAPSANVAFADITASGLEYRGVLFKNNNANDDDTEPVWVRRSSSGVLTGGNYSDFEGNVENTSEGVTLTFDSQPSPGVLLATLADPGGPSDFVFVVNQVDGSFVLYGISQDVGNNMQPYNVLLVSQ